MATKKRQSSSQKHAELKRLGDQSRSDIFRMLQLADEILADHDWKQLCGELEMQLERSENRTAELLEQVARLSEECETLRRDKAMLEGRLLQLEKLQAV